MGIYKGSLGLPSENLIQNMSCLILIGFLKVADKFQIAYLPYYGVLIGGTMIIGVI